MKSEPEHPLRATPELVRGKVRQYWPDGVDQVMLLLESSVEIMREGEGWDEARARVQLAVIKLTEGVRDELEGCVEMARRDYRDVLAYAEYPEEMKSGFAADSRLSPHELNEVRLIRARDRQQYEAWLMHDVAD